MMVATLSLGFWGCQGSKLSIEKEKHIVHDSILSEHEEEDREERFIQIHNIKDKAAWEKQNEKVLAEKNIKYQERRQQRLERDLNPASPNPDEPSQLDVNSLTMEEAVDAGINGEWIERGSDNQAGRVISTTYHEASNTIYAISQGGNIWKGTLDGNDWVSQNDQRKFSAPKVLYHFVVNGNVRLFIVTSGGAYYSDDEGVNWTLVSSISSSNGLINATQVGENSIMVTGDNRGTSGFNVYLSEDNGLTFNVVHSRSNSSGRFDIASVRNSDGSYDTYLQEENHTYKWDGSTFNLAGSFDFSLHSEVSSATRPYITVTNAGGDPTIYVGLYSNGRTYIYVSEDDGDTWRATGSINHIPFKVNGFHASITSKGYLFLGGTIFTQSSDAGLTWAWPHHWSRYAENPKGVLHADVPEVKQFVKSDGEDFYLICTDGGVYKSFDDIETVENITLKGMRASQYYFVNTMQENPTTFYAGAQDQGWQRVVNDSGSVVDFEQVEGGDFGMTTSGDGGQSVWGISISRIHYAPVADRVNEFNTVWMNLSFRSKKWLAPIVADPDNNNSVLIGAGGLTGVGNANGAYLYRVSYNGESLELEQLPFDFNEGGSSAYVYIFAISPINSDFRYVGTSAGRFYYTTDGGDNWTRSTTSLVRVNDIVPSHTELGKVYILGAATLDRPIFVSDNHGHTFSNIPADLPSRTTFYGIDIDDDGEHLFGAAVSGPYVLRLASNEWFDLGGPLQNYQDVEFVSEINAVRFATYGRGVWDYVLEDGSSSSSSEEPSSSSVVSSSSSEPVSSSSSVVTLPNFGDKAAPGRLEAEYFDAFNETSPGNNGNWNDRNGENTGVDMEFTGDAGGGANVGWTDAGEWLEYNFDVAQSGSYEFSLRVASAQGTRNVSISVNGAAAQNFSYTGSAWQTYQDLVTITANLTAGQNTVRVTFIDGATNLNYIEVEAVSVSSSSSLSSSSEPVSSSSVVSSSSEPVSSSSVVSSSSEPVSSSSVVSSSSEPVSSSSVVSSSSEPVSSSSSVVTLPNFGNKAAPGKLEAEFFDAFNETSAGNNGNWNDRNGENTGVDMEFTGDVGGGANVGWTDAGEWLEYNFDVTQSGSYEFVLRVASAMGARNVSVSVNGAAAQNFSYTGSAWQTYQNLATVTAALSAGQNTLRVTFIDGATNLNYIDVQAVAVSSSSEEPSSSSEEPSSSSEEPSSSSEPVSSSSVVSSSSEPVSSSSISTGVTGTEYDACVQTNGSVDVGVPGKNNSGDFFGGYRNGQWFFGQQQSSCNNGVCNISNVSANVGDSFQYFCQGGGCDADGYYPGNNNQPGSVLTLRACE